MPPFSCGLKMVRPAIDGCKIEKFPIFCSNLQRPSPLRPATSVVLSATKIELNAKNYFIKYICELNKSIFCYSPFFSLSYYLWKGLRQTCGNWEIKPQKVSNTDSLKIKVGATAEWSWKFFILFKSLILMIVPLWDLNYLFF